MQLLLRIYICYYWRRFRGKVGEVEAKVGVVLNLSHNPTIQKFLDPPLERDTACLGVV